jgi:hypothetical protein
MELLVSWCGSPPEASMTNTCSTPPAGDVKVTV